MHFVAKQGIEEMRDLKPKVKKMRSKTKCGAHLSNPVFGKKREEKREKILGKVGDQGYGWVCFPFLAPKRSSN